MRNWLIVFACCLMGCSTTPEQNTEMCDQKIPEHLLKVEPMPASNLPEEATNADAAVEIDAYSRWCEAGWARVRSIGELQRCQ